MYKILFLSFILFLAGCTFEERIFLAEEEINEPGVFLKQDLGIQQVAPLVKKTKPSERVVNYSFIRNDAKVNLTLIIRQLQLDQKVLLCSPQLLNMLEKEILPELELNQSQNKDITVGRWNTRMALLETLWAKHVSEQEKGDLLHALKGTWNMVGVPKEAKEEELLDHAVVQNLALFFHGVADALQPYKQIAPEQKDLTSPVVVKKEEPPTKETVKVEKIEEKKPLVVKEEIPSAKPKETPKAEPGSSPGVPKVEGESKVILDPQIKLEPKVKVAPEIKLAPEPRIFGD